MQDAPRKFRPPSQVHAGAWTGTIFEITESIISKTVSQEKWDKGKRIIKGISLSIQEAAAGRPILNRKQLEKETGFLNHLAMTFDTITPFLKGFYLTLNSWRDGRDDRDWKVTSKQWKEILFNRAANGGLSEGELDEELSRSVESSQGLLRSSCRRDHRYETGFANRSKVVSSCAARSAAVSPSSNATADPLWTLAA